MKQNHARRISKAIRRGNLEPYRIQSPYRASGGSKLAEAIDRADIYCTCGIDASDRRANRTEGVDHGTNKKEQSTDHRKRASRRAISTEAIISITNRDHRRCPKGSVRCIG